MALEERPTGSCALCAAQSAQLPELRGEVANLRARNEQLEKARPSTLTQQFDFFSPGPLFSSCISISAASQL